MPNRRAPHNSLSERVATKLAKKPEEPADSDGPPVTAALMLKSFGYMRRDRHGVNWNEALFDEDGKQVAHCKLVDRKLACKKS